jgi:hypothetical protein
MKHLKELRYKLEDAISMEDQPEPAFCGQLKAVKVPSGKKRDNYFPPSCSISANSSLSVGTLNVSSLGQTVLHTVSLGFLHASEKWENIFSFIRLDVALQSSLCRGDYS